MTSWVSAISTREDPARMTLSPANCPADVRFNSEINTACRAQIYLVTMHYLHDVRGLSIASLEKLTAEGRLSQEEKTGNAVFKSSTRMAYWSVRKRSVRQICVSNPLIKVQQTAMALK